MLRTECVIQTQLVAMMYMYYCNRQGISIQFENCSTAQGRVSQVAGSHHHVETFLNRQQPLLHQGLQLLLLLWRGRYLLFYQQQDNSPVQEVPATRSGTAWRSETQSNTT